MMFVILSLFFIISYCDNGIRTNYCFGWNQFGVCGVGDREHHKEPVKLGSGDPFFSLSEQTGQYDFTLAGYRHSFLSFKNKIYGYGTNDNCMLGFIENHSVYPVPTELNQPILSDKTITKISSNYAHTIMLTSNNEVYTWGSNTRGQLGMKNKGYSCKPQQPTDLTDAVDISTGNCHSLVTLQNGNVFGMGCNDYSQLGSEKSTSIDFFQPTQIKFPDYENVKIKKLSAGSTFSVFLDSDGNVFFSGHLTCDDGKNYTQKTPKIVLPADDDPRWPKGGFGGVHSGNNHFVAVHSTEGSIVVGFGCNDWKQLGEGQPSLSSQGVVLDLTSVYNVTETKDISIKKAVAMNRNTMLLLERGRLFYMGQDMSIPFFDNMGEGKKMFSELTELVVPDGEKLLDVDASIYHLTAISNQSVFCLGENSYFQCGNTNVKWYTTFQKPYNEEFETHQVTEVQLWSQHALAITEDGKVYTFGIGTLGQLGNGGISDNFFPVPVRIEPEYTKIIDGDTALRAGIILDDRGKVYTFGSGDGGLLGTGVLETQDYPKPIPSSLFHENDIVSVGANSRAMIALTASGEVYVWGESIAGELGLGMKDRYIKYPKKLKVYDDEKKEKVKFRTVHTGVHSTLAISTDNVIYEWGWVAADPNFPVLYEPTVVYRREKESDVINFVHAGLNFNLFVINNNQLFIKGVVGNIVSSFHKNCDEPKKSGSTRTFYDYHLFWETKKRIVTCHSQYHSICILEDGEVYGFGSNEWNQLSTNDEISYYSNFTRLEINDDYGGLKYSKVALGMYTTILMEKVQCGYLFDSDDGVCSSRGLCTRNDHCSCFYGYTGPDCTEFKCYNMSQHDPNVCFGHGQCIGREMCHCDENWLNTDPSYENSGRRSSEYGYCRYPNCPSRDSKVCAGHGECNKTVTENGISVPVCACNEEYRGDSCQLFRCHGATTNSEDQRKDGCGNYARCTGYNKCTCKLTGLNILLPLRQKPNEGCVVSVGTILMYFAVLFVVFLVCYLCYCTGLCFCCFCRQWNIGRRLERESKVARENLVSKQQSDAHKENFYAYQSPAASNKSINFDQYPTSSGSRNEEEEKTMRILLEKSGEIPIKSSSLEKQKKKDGFEPASPTETTILLDSQGGLSVKRERRWRIDLGLTHVFEGDAYDGKGTIFYVDIRGNEYPVFRGKFKNGCKNGHGIEYFIHHKDRKTLKKSIEYGSSFYTDARNFRFSGYYKNDLRDGKGSEYDGKGNKSLVGEYRNGMLFRILSIDFPVEKIDLQEDIIYPEKNFLLGEGGFSLILAGRIKRNRKKCAVKIYKDRYEEQRKMREKAEQQQKSKREEEESEGEVDEDEDRLPFQDGGYMSSDYGSGGDALVQHQKLWEFKRLFQSVGNVIKIMSMFPHNNIVEVMGWSGPVAEITKFGYVMERCVGSVRQRFFDEQRPSITMREKNLIMYHTALGMRHVHNVMGLIHRDLKWGNILLDKFGQPKICDFDMADRDDMNFSGRRNFGNAQGSCFHIAPECLVRKSFDYKCDVYSFGIMMYEICFNKLGDPFDILSRGECHVCQERFDLSNIPKYEQPYHLQRIMEEHYTKCKIRPRLEDFEYLDDFTPFIDGVSGGGTDETDGSMDLYHTSNWQMGISTSISGIDVTQIDSVVRVFKWQVALMTRCWRDNPDERPNFQEIVEIFLANNVGEGEEERRRRLRRRRRRGNLSAKKLGKEPIEISINSGDKY